MWAAQYEGIVMSNLAKILTGQSEEHLTQDFLTQKFIHKEMVLALDALRNDALSAGFSLAIASSFRSFEAQLKIWNAKARGERVLLDSHGVALDFSLLSKKELIHAILRWSALPGASRHHWGTDFDVFDANALVEGYKVQLTTAETEGEGLFAPFHLWLDGSLEKHGFYRPYSDDRGGIAPEKWHLSFRKIANEYEREFTYELLEQTIINADIELKDIILEELPEIFRRYVQL